MNAISTPEHQTTLAVGIVALEFSAAVSAFVSSTLLPTVARDLHAHNHWGLLLAGSPIGLFVALPLAARLVRRLGAARTASVGMVGYVGGAVVAATSCVPLVFAAGQFVGGLAGGLLAVFGISSIIRQLDERLRLRVVAASSAMWVLPALVGPAATLALAHEFGWRWTLLAPVPIVLIGRLLVVRAADEDVDADVRPLGRTLLIPLGVGGMVLSSGYWPLLGAAVALCGVVAIMPAGTATLRRGVPAALAAMVLFATGYFGADSLITVLLTDGYRVSLARAAIMLSAAPLAWALTSLVVRRVPATVGLAVAACGVAVLAVGTSYVVALVAWTVTGVGIGLAYPGLYLRCTSTGNGFDATELAAAVITAEAFGGLLGRAGGGAVGLGAAYALFAAVLAAAAIVGCRGSQAAG
jgi:MFS family permease